MNTNKHGRLKRVQNSILHSGTELQTDLRPLTTQKWTR